MIIKQLANSEAINPGPEYTKAFVCTKCTGIQQVWEALGNGTLPQKGDQFTLTNGSLTWYMYADYPSIVAVEEMKEYGGTDAAYIVTYSYKQHSGSLSMDNAHEPPRVMTVSITSGTTTKTLETDIESADQIGHSYYFTKIESANWEEIAEQKYFNPDAQIGVERYYPTKTVQIEMPKGTLSNTSLYDSLTAHTNQYDMVIAGQTYLAECLLYLTYDVSLTPSGAESIIHTFTYGYINDLPTDKAIYKNWGSYTELWESSILPIRYCINPVPKLEYITGGEKPVPKISTLWYEVNRRYKNGNLGLLFPS